MNGFGDLGVQIKNDNSALIVTVGNGVSERNDEVSPDGSTRDESTGTEIVHVGPRIGAQKGTGSSTSTVVVSESGLVLHVLVPNLSQGLVCMSQIVEMNGHDSLLDSLHLYRSHFSKRFQFPPHQPLAHFTRDRTQHQRPRRRRRRWQNWRHLYHVAANVRGVVVLLLRRMDVSYTRFAKRHHL